LVVGFGHRVGDDAGKLGDAGQRELERRTLCEERTQPPQLVVGDDGGGQPRIQERDREGDLLRDPLRVELPMRSRKLCADVLEREGDRRFERPRRDARH
jgi:hypothetical protein